MEGCFGARALALDRATIVFGVTYVTCFFAFVVPIPAGF
jgi:hypothetical protein